MPVGVYLARLAPEAETVAAAALSHAVRDALGGTDSPPRLRQFTCLGRYESIVFASPTVVGTNMQQFDIPYFSRLKKLDLQLCYHCCDDLALLFPASAGNATELAFISYVRVRDDLTLGLGGPLLRRIKDHLRTVLSTYGDISTVVLTPHGWPTFILLTYGRNIDTLSEAINEHVWHLRLSDMGYRVSRGDQAVFSRTTSMAAFSAPLEGGRHDFQGLTGTVFPPVVTLRVRPGRDAALEPAIGKLTECGVRCDTRLELGEDDLTIVTGAEGRIGIAELLRAYCDGFLPAAQDDVYSTELHLRLPWGGGQKQDMVERVVHVGPASLGTDADGAPADATTLRPLERMQGIINWAMSNDGIASTMGDLYLHTEWLAHFVKHGIYSPTDIPSYVISESQQFSEGFGQRLSGSYYGLMSYMPESLLEYSGGMHSLLLVLWGIQQDIMETIGYPEAPGYWVISKGDPATLVNPGNSFIGRLPATAVGSLPSCLFDIGHEVGHMAYTRCNTASRPDASDRLDEVLDELLVSKLLSTMYTEAGIPDDDLAAKRHLLERYGPLIRTCLPEVFADAFSLACFTGSDVEEALRSFRRALPWCSSFDSARRHTIVLRAWVMWCQRDLADGFVPYDSIPEYGIICEKLLDPELPLFGSEPHNREQYDSRLAETWEAFAKYLMDTGSEELLVGTKEKCLAALRRLRLLDAEAVWLYDAAVLAALAIAQKVRGTPGGNPSSANRVIDLVETLRQNKQNLHYTRTLDRMWDRANSRLGVRLESRGYGVAHQLQ